MRGEVTRDARPRRARQTLIAVQVGASALLLICAAIFLRGAFAAATQDPDVRTNDTLRVSIETETRRAAILQDLRTHPSVAIVAASSRSTGGVIETFVSPSRVSVDQLAVSSEYFTVLGLDLVSGRGFTPAERTAEAGVVVVSQSLARQLWPNGGGVGQVVRLEAPQPASSGAPSPSFAYVDGHRHRARSGSCVRDVLPRRCTFRPDPRARGRGCICASAATRIRCASRCSNASRASIPCLAS